MTQSIDLTDIAFATVKKSYAPHSPNTGGTLTVKDGNGDVANLKFSGTYTLASFNLADDGHGGVLITDPPVENKPQTSILTLLGNYIASSFASAIDRHAAISTSWAETPVAQLIGSPHG